VILLVCWVFAPLGLLLYLAARRIAAGRQGSA